MINCLKGLMFVCGASILLSCGTTEKEEQIVLPTECVAISVDTGITYPQLINLLPTQVVGKVVEVPDENGAMGRNKSGYFHVRFQFNLPKLVDYAIRTQNEEALSHFIKALDYSFKYQKADGSFELDAPEELGGNSALSEGDLLSATAFFGYSLGLSLHSLEKGTDLLPSTLVTPVNEKVAFHEGGIKNMLEYLKVNAFDLQRNDAHAPNRLLFDAIVFYTLGEYLNDTVAIGLGKEFLEKALALTDPDEGFFIESGGWDSSYNGVAVKIGFELYTILRSDKPERSHLLQKVTCAALWQASRVLETGEVSTVGNTRVYPGGEGFLGGEKKVDVEKTLLGLYYFSIISGDKSYEQKAEKVIDFYF